MSIHVLKGAWGPGFLTNSTQIDFHALLGKTEVVRSGKFFVSAVGHDG